jgi:hypothetical protein
MAWELTDEKCAVCDHRHFVDGDYAGWCPIPSCNCSDYQRKGEKQMSWSISTGLLSKHKAARALDETEFNNGVNSAWTLDQFETAKNAAKELLKGIPGPYVVINMSGHGNGVGFQVKPGYSNDTITVSVVQQGEPDLKRYNSIDGGPMPAQPGDNEE